MDSYGNGSTDTTGLCPFVGCLKRSEALYKCDYYFLFLFYFLPQIVKIPGVKNYKYIQLKSNCRMVIGPAGELAEYRAKARS